MLLSGLSQWSSKSIGSSCLQVHSLRKQEDALTRCAHRLLALDMTRPVLLASVLLLTFLRSVHFGVADADLSLHRHFVACALAAELCTSPGNFYVEALEAINGGIEPGVLFEVIGLYAPNEPGRRFVRGRLMMPSEPSAGKRNQQKLNNDLQRTTLEHVSGMLSVWLFQTEFVTTPDRSLHAVSLCVCVAKRCFQHRLRRTASARH